MAAQKKVEFEQDFSTYRILIEGLPQLVIMKQSFHGFTAYKQGGVYYIEIWMNEKNLVVYESRELWVKVLKLLHENI